MFDVFRATTWNEAEAECQRQGSHLLSLHDSDTYHEIQKYDREGSPLMFIGLQKQVSKDCNDFNACLACVRYNPILVFKLLAFTTRRMVRSAHLTHFSNTFHYYRADQFDFARKIHTASLSTVKLADLSTRNPMKPSPKGSG